MDGLYYVCSIAFGGVLHQKTSYSTLAAAIIDARDMHRDRERYKEVWIEDKNGHRLTFWL